MSFEGDLRSSQNVNNIIVIIIFFFHSLLV